MRGEHFVDETLSLRARLFEFVLNPAVERTNDGAVRALSRWWSRGRFGVGAGAGGGEGVRGTGHRGPDTTSDGAGPSPTWPGSPRAPALRLDGAGSGQSVSPTSFSRWTCHQPGLELSEVGTLTK